MPNITPSAKRYLSQIPSHVKVSDFPLTKFDLSKLESYKVDLPVFDTVRMNDIGFISKNFDTINLFRGCKVGCLHCMRNAVAPKTNRESILYEDLRRLVFGFRTLSERMGFNVLNGNKAIHITDDSELIDFHIIGKKRKHSVADAIELIYNSLKIPAILETSGWDNLKGRSGGYLLDYRAAKKLVTQIKKNPDSVKEVRVSISPFVESNDYIGRMANTLYRFLDLFKSGKANIVYKHAREGITGFDAYATENIYRRIFSALKEMTGSALEGFPQLSPEVVCAPSKAHIIEPSGRGSKYSKGGKALLKMRLEKDALRWNRLTKDQQGDIILNQGKKRIDIDGSVYTAVPTKVVYNTSPLEVMFPANIHLNFLNKEKPHKIFTDYEF